jgi:serine/threonine-protein kinase
MFPRELPRALEGFDILQRLGAGGAGEVFLARSRAGQLVAIKTITDARFDTHGGEAVDSFAREAAVCVRLRHPCIVKVRAFLEEPEFAALVFEYVPGVALARVLRFCQSKGIRLPDRPAWHIVERMLSALAYAHGFHDEAAHPTPIVHRDVSPSNVLLDWDGGVKITDFGIAKVLGVSPGTRYGIVKGTLGYMAPEQARGEPVDERADVYAAGLLAWRLATGRVPYRKQKDEFELLRAMRNPRIPSLAVLRPDLPEPLLQALERAMEPERDKRTITANELAEVVRAALDVAAGGRELARLLEGWRGALERTVKRVAAPGDTTSGTTSGDSSDSSQKALQTLRYEEVALAFDEDDVPDDGPTFEAHALPSDSALLVAMPTEERAAPAAGEQVVTSADPVASPPTRLAGEGPRHATGPVEEAAPQEAAEPLVIPRTPALGRVLAVLAFVVVGIAAAVLAALGR